MKYIITAILLIAASISFQAKATDWSKIAAIASGASQTWQAQEAQRIRQQNYNYAVEQQARAMRHNNPQNHCNAHCRQQRHNLQTELLRLQIQNNQLRSQGY